MNADGQHRYRWEFAFAEFVPKRLGELGLRDGSRLVDLVELRVDQGYFLAARCRCSTQITELLGRLKFDDEVLEWVREALHASHADERREHEEAIKRHQAEYKRLNDRIHAMYVDKLDGLVDTAFFEKMSNQWREEQSRCQRETERHQNADKSYLEEGVQLLELARNAQRLFAQQEPREKRRLLNFLLSNCTWEDGEVVATFREPFDLLAETATNSINLGIGETFKSAKNDIWLGNSDSNLDKEIPPCQRRIMAAQACLKSAIKLFGKDWHSSANRAVLWPVSGSDGVWDPAPPAPSPRRGFGGAAQRRPEPRRRISMSKTAKKRPSAPSAPRASCKAPDPQRC